MQRSKSVGILTFHHGYNYGGFLQCFSLQTALKELGADPYVINYINPKHRRKKFKQTFIQRRPRAIFDQLQKRKIFERLHSSYFNSINEQDATKLDAIIVGSDEVWNYKNPMFGFDPKYFLSNYHLPKFSYACSFGTQSDSVELPGLAMSSLKRFKQISVRDYNSKNHLNDHGISASIHVDPTFLINQDNYLQKAKIPDLYILVYGFNFSRSVKESLLRLASHKNAKLVSVGFRNQFCDVNLMDLNPFQWSYVFKNAHLICTSMFHGLVYSLIHKKGFVFCENDYRRNKVEFLKVHYDLQDYFIDQSDGFYEIDQPDYSSFACRHREMVCESKDYLREVIRNA